MTVSYPILTTEQLDFRALVRHLSRHDGFPCPLHVRNHFLAQYGAQVGHAALQGKTLDDDPWRTYDDYRRGASVVAIGDVPLEVRNGQENSQGPIARAAHGEGLWALVIVYPSYAPGWVEQGADAAAEADVIWNGMRMALWLSTERAGRPAALDTVRDADQWEMALLRFICEQHLPCTVSKLAASQRPGTIKRHGQSDAVLVDLFAVNHSWARALDELGRQGLSSGFQVTRMNPCMTFVMAEEEACRLAAIHHPSRWAVRPIGDSEREIRLVRIYPADALYPDHAKLKDYLKHIQIIDSNNLTFPSWYIRHRRHNSVFITDGPSSEATTSYYPDSVQPGAPVGWAYAHDDFSLGSLHVAQPYRRNRDKDGSVGQICLGLMASQLIDAQKAALSMAGCPDDLPAPYLSDSELRKDVAVSFHTKMGFYPSSISTWGAFAIRIKGMSLSR